MILILQMRNPRLRERLTNDARSTASKCQSWDSHSGFPAPVSVLTLARYESWDFVPWSLFDVESLTAFEEVNDLI